MLDNSTGANATGASADPNAVAAAMGAAPAPAAAGPTVPVASSAASPTNAAQAAPTAAPGAGGTGAALPAGVPGAQPGIDPAALAALQGRFNVTDNPGAKPAPNTVSPADFMKIAQQYADVAAGRGDVKIDTSGMDPTKAASFKDGAMNDIANLLQSPNGRDMLANLQNNVAKDAAGNPIKDASGNDVHRTTSIGQSYAPQRDATGNPVRDPTTGAPVPAGGPGAAPVADPSAAAADYANPSQWWQAYKNMYPGAPGPGAGMDSNVRYVPGQNYMGARSDVILAHELAHATDMTQGRMDNTPVPGGSPVPQDTGVPMSEYQAMGLGAYAGTGPNENSYRADRADIGAAGTPGALPGDAGMPQRTSYR